MSDLSKLFNLEPYNLADNSEEREPHVQQESIIASNLLQSEIEAAGWKRMKEILMRSNKGNIAAHFTTQAQNSNVINNKDHEMISKLYALNRSTRNSVEVNGTEDIISQFLRHPKYSSISPSFSSLQKLISLDENPTFGTALDPTGHGRSQTHLGAIRNVIGAMDGGSTANSVADLRSKLESLRASYPNTINSNFIHGNTNVLEIDRGQSMLQKQTSSAGLDYSRQINISSSLRSQLIDAAMAVNQRIDPVVSPYIQDDPGWEEQFRALCRYRSEFGDCRVPARCKCNPKLGHWVMTQRRQFTLLMQGRPSALTAERVERLESVGFVWSVRPEPAVSWNQKLQELKEYKTKFGNCMVPQRYPDNMKLGTWVHTQRRHHKLMLEGKKSSMTREKAKILDSLGFSWTARQSALQCDKDETSDVVTSA